MTIAAFRRRRWTGDLTFRAILATLTLGITVVLGVMMFESFASASPVYQKFGIIGFVAGYREQPSFTVYGAWAFIYGTLLRACRAGDRGSSVRPIALLLTELAPARLRRLGIAVDLLAAVPSVVYGLWGLLVLVPASVRSKRRSEILGRIIPFFGPPTPGSSYFVAGVILAVMTIPICRPSPARSTLRHHASNVRRCWPSAVPAGTWPGP